MQAFKTHKGQKSDSYLRTPGYSQFKAWIFYLFCPG